MKVAAKKTDNKAVKTSLEASNFALNSVEPMMRLARYASKKAIRTSIKVLQLVIRILRNLLMAAEALVIIVDIIVFIVLVIVAYFYLTYLGG